MVALIKPSTDFSAVRDGRNSQYFYVDVDLSSARSVAAGTALVLNVSGNSFYCDANPSDGNCYIHFQDTNFDRAPAPLYVSPGVIFNLPFTRFLLENTAQTGKKVRLVYGIDVDFQPGSVAQIAVTSSGGYMSIRPETPNGWHYRNTALAANTAETVFTPASNAGGAVLINAGGFTYVGASISFPSLIAHTSTPSAITDGLLLFSAIDSAGTGYAMGGMLDMPLSIPAGYGLYFISADNVPAAVSSQPNFRFCAYKKL